MRANRVKTVLGFLVSAVIVAVFVHTVGLGKILFALNNADLTLVAAGVLFSLISVVLRVQGWLTVIRGRTGLDWWKGGKIWFSLQFANNITPFGQAGGEPVIAYLYAQQTDVPADKGFATVLTADLLNAVPMFTLPVVGVALYLSSAAYTSTVGALLQMLVLVFVLFAGGIFLTWRLQQHVLTGLHWSGDTLHSLLSILGLEHVPLLDRVRGQVFARVGDQLYTVFNEYAADRRRLGTAIVYAHLSDLVRFLSIYAFLVALGASPDYTALLFIMPIVSLANFLPLPGGLGGVEVAMTTAITGVMGIAPAIASAAVLLLRINNYWFFTVVGGYLTVTTAGLRRG